MSQGEKIPRSASSDLKLQLGELQRKFAPHSIRGAPTNQPQIHLPPMISSQKQPQQPVVNTTSKTVDYLGDLSDGLLLESRRLTHENNIYKSKMTKLDQENSNLKKQLNNLNTVFEKSNNREEEINDQKWELELKLKNLEKTHARSVQELINFKSTQSTSIKSHDELNSTLDTLKSERDQLEKALNLQINSMKSEISALKDSNENLNDENDLLHQNFITLKSDFESVKQEKDQLLAQLAVSDSSGSNDDEFNHTFDDSVLVDPLPLQQINTLDKETLQRNLTHAYSIIKKLRLKNLKLKSPRKSPLKSNLDNWGDEDQYIQDSFELNAIPDLAISDSDSDNDEFKGIVSSSPLRTNDPTPSNGDFVIIVPSNMDANDVLSNIDSYKSIPVNKSEFKVLNSIPSRGLTSPIKFNPKSISSSKYSDNHMVKLVTLDELNDLKDILKEKELEIQYLKSTAVTSAATTTTATIGATNSASTAAIGAVNATSSAIGAAGVAVAGATSLALAGGLTLVSKERDNKSINNSIPLETHQHLLNEHKNLKAKFDEPDLSYLKSMVSKRGFITLPQIEFDDLKTSFDKKDSKLHSLEINVNELDNELKSLKGQIDERDIKLVALKSQISERDTKLEAVETQIDQKNVQIKSLQSQVVEKESQLKSSKLEIGEIGTKLMMFESQLEKKDAKLLALESEIDEKTIKLESLQSQLVAKDSKLLKLESDIGQHVVSLGSLKSDISERNSKLQSLQSQIDSPDHEYIKSMSATHGLIALPITEHESMKARLSETETQLKSLTSQVSERDIKLESLKTQIDSPDQEYIKSMSATHGLIAIPMVEHDSLKSKLSDMDVKLSSLDTQIMQKDSQLELLKSQLSQSDSKLQLLQIQIGQKDNALESLEVQIGKKINELALLQTQINERETELESLQQKIDSPDTDYIKAKSTDHGLTVVPIVEHDSMKLELTQLASQLDELNAHKVSVDTELDEKREMIVKTELELANLKLVESDLQLLQKEKEIIDKKVSTLQDENDKLNEVSNLLDLMKIEFEQLQAKIDEPSLEYIKTKSSLHNIIPVPLDEHESMQKEISETKSQIQSLSSQIALLESSKSDLESMHIEKDQHIGSMKSDLESKVKHLDALQSQLDFPSLDFIKAKSTSHGLVSVPLVEHESLKNQLKSHQDELISLKSNLENPSVDYLQSKSTAKGLTVLSNDLHDSLHDQLNSLKFNIETPNADYIKSKASLHDLIAVPMIEHESIQKKLAQLEQSIENPDMAYIESKAEMHGFISIPIKDHSSLKSELISKSDELDFISKELENKHAQLESLLEEKSQVELKLGSLENIEYQFTDIQTQLGSKEKELSDLQLKFDNPTHDYIKSKSSDHGLISITMEHHSSLTTQLDDNKTELKKMESEIIGLRKVKEDLELQGVKSVSMELHDSVQTELAETKDKSNEIFKKLEIINHELESRDEKIEKLQVEANELKQKSDKLIQVETELLSLKNARSELSVKHMEFLQLQAVHDDLVKNVDVLKNVELELEHVKSELKCKTDDLLKLQNSLDNPTEDYIKVKSKELGLVSILDKDHESLRNDLELKLKQIEQLQSVKSELESNQLELDHLKVTNTDLQYKIDDLKLVEYKLADVTSTLESKEIDLASVNKLLETPDIDYIKSKSELHNLVAIPMTEHTNTINELISLKDIVGNKEKELAVLKADKSDLDIEKTHLASQITQLEKNSLKLNDDLNLKEEQLTEHKLQIETPSAEYIKSKSELHGLISVPREEFHFTKSNLEYANSVAVDRERELIGLKSSLEAIIVERDGLLIQLDELKAKSTKELKVMKGLYETPSSDYLKLKASKMGLTMIAVAEFQSLNSKLASLTADLNQKTQMVDSLQSKVSTLEAPSKEYIHTRSTAMGFIPIPIFEHKNLTSNVESNKKIISVLEASKKQLSDELDQLKESHKNVLIQRDENINSLQKQINEPTMDYVKSSSVNHGLIAIPIDDHRSLTKDIENHKFQLANKNKELDEHKVQLDAKHNEVTKLVTANDDFIKKVNELETDLVQVKDQSQNKHKEVEDLTIQHDYSLKRVECLEKELTLLNAKLQDELSENEKNVESLKIELSEKSDAIEKLQKEIYKPTPEYVRSKAIIHGLVPLPTEEHDKMKSELAEHKAELVNLAIVKTKLDAKHGELETHIAELDEVRNQLNEKHKEIESLEMTKTDSLKRVSELELELSSLNAKLVTDLKESNKVIVSLKNELDSKTVIIDQLQKEMEAPSAEYVKSKSAIHGFIPFPVVDHNSLTSQLEDQKVKIGSLQSKFDDTIQKLEDFQQKAVKESGELQQYHYDELTKKDQLIGRLESQLENAETQLKDVQLQLEKVEDSSDEEIDDVKLEQRALDRGFVLLPIPQSKEIFSNTMEKSSSVATITQDGFKVSESSLNAILNVMDNNGFKCIPVDKYDELISRPEADATGEFNIDEDDLANATLEADEIKSQLESKKNELNKLESSSRRTSFISVSSGSSTVSVNDLLHGKELSIKKKRDSIIENIQALEEKKNGIQRQINRISVTSFDLEMASNADLNTRLDKKLSTINDKIELANIELHSQQSALDAVRQYIKSAKSMDLAPIHIQNSFNTANDSKSIHTLDQITVLKDDIVELESKFNSKVEELEDLRQQVNKSIQPQDMITRLTALGYVVNKNHIEGGVALKSIESTTSSATTNASEYFDAESYITQSGASIEPELKSRAAELGLALIPITEVSKDQTTVAKATARTFIDLQLQSHELGYELVKIDELSNLKKLAQELPESLDIVDLQMYANKLDLKLLADEDIQQLKRRPVTSKELAIKAAELKLVMLSEQEANELETKKPITSDNLVDRAKMMGFLCIPISQYIATTVARECDVTTAVVLSNTYYKRLLKSHDFFKKNNNKSIETFAPPAIPEEAPYVPTTPTMSISNIDATSLHTVNTVISGKQEIIAAVAQTIIGEYLYKYYRKLGPLSSIADSRHERYFWIHPYSLTIYWSVNNPVLTDPGKTQIKAMSIVSVQSVDDNNPLPPGVYHKSIIIKSHDKSIKLTCPTRQRHNIWFNSLKYLIEKSTENWVNDDDVEDQYTQTFHMDKRIDLDRTQSMSFRHSQPRNVSFKSLESRRISSVPAMRSSLRN